MQELIKKVERLADFELERANRVHTPFASAHEGYAVILEELEEAKEALSIAEYQLGTLWKFIKEDDMYMAQAVAAAMLDELIPAAAELVQAIAMGKKFKALEPVKGRDCPSMPVEDEGMPFL